MCAAGSRWAFDNCPRARRVVCSEWPDVLHYKDVKDVGETQVVE